jgi:hypothetical protein
MSPKKVSRSFIHNMQRLIAGETLTASAFSNKQQLSQLVEDRALVMMIKGRGRSSYRCLDPTVLRRYLLLHFGITDLNAYSEALKQDNRDGENSLLAATSTKALRQKSLRGFFIKAFESELGIAGQPLGALPAGVEYFVHDLGALQISPSALVVGVENPECYVKAGQLQGLFPQKELVFVLRYYGKSSVEWLQTVENSYLHFGDFDPAGISIYCTEYLSNLGEERCRFFVPDGIEGLLETHGLPELFDRQVHLWPPKAEIRQVELLELIDLINQFGKGLEQEQLLAHTTTQ